MLFRASKFSYRSPNTPRPPSSIDIHYAHFSGNYIHPWNHVWYLHIGHPTKENQQCMSSFSFSFLFFFLNWFKGCACHIFASLFFMSKREHLWNKEKCFLFHFESSFRSWDNQILTFQIFKCHDIIKCPTMKHETHFTE